MRLLPALLLDKEVQRKEIRQHLEQESNPRELSRSVTSAIGFGPGHCHPASKSPKVAGEASLGTDLKGESVINVGTQSLSIAISIWQRMPDRVPLAIGGARVRHQNTQ